MAENEQELRAAAREFGQEHVFHFWDSLDEAGRASLLHDLGQVDFKLMARLAKEWILNKPEPEHFKEISPVPVIPKTDPSRPDAQEAWEAGEAALRAGRVGLFLVAGGQGTRLGFDGPKGSYPIGGITGKTLFEYHADKVVALQRTYGCVLPWYIMVSEANGPATEAFFRDNDCFGLNAKDIAFLTQRMVPCMDENGKFLLERSDHLAMNPNGHGGCLTAMVECGVLDDARSRGVDFLSYFQVDNWAVKVADPYFIGYHVLRGSSMSSKNHRKHFPREAVGVHCLCDGEYRVIEYSELDIYPQLLETDSEGKVVYYAGNPAIHILSVDFVQQVYEKFDEFPWHLAHKKIAYIDDSGALVLPEKPNGYKFETFVFDALRFATHPPVALEIDPPGEYTPTKQFDGENSVVEARASMSRYWSHWLDAAGTTVPRDSAGNPTIAIEISPRFALTQEQFVTKSKAKPWPVTQDLYIDGSGVVRASINRN
ncbi:MAG: UTP--glucose-1-phosphate uridylyltransferase [Candidatus Hydrogenedentes bacterium]|nr:UTP--glucose-1-phosphate uridylyltransferase [Candidatus Hydrogenedentota bacterium]